MATLVLSVVGRALGGPIGAILGAALGGVVDRDVLLRPKGVEGPRLAALHVQTSNYGTPLQLVFGTMRVGGCVIWSTDLIESKATSGGGKGQPSATTYSYSASFAVALSGRPIVGVGRIWADGNLLRGSAGDFKTATAFRLHLGGEDQAVDPLIAAAEGAGLAPAHRGIAYAVFESLQLADYGNRIPSLTFEVIGDPAPVTVGAIAAALGGGMVDGTAATQTLGGFAAYGDSVASVLDTLARAGGAWFAPDGAIVRMRAGETPVQEIAAGEASPVGGPVSKHGRAVAALETVARQVTLSHYDPAREYQIGLQVARRPGAGRREDQVEFPAAIDAGTAKTLAAAILARGEAARERRTVALGWDAVPVAPGACVTIAGVAGIWRVTGWSLEHMVLSLDCVRLASGTLPIAATPGRVLAAPDVATGATVLAAFESLPFDDAVLAAPRVTIVAAGTGPGWRRAAVLYSIDEGARWTAFGATAAPGTLGRLASVPGPAASAIFDRRRAFKVDLLHPAMTLESADAGALDAGANLALVGDELLQFATAIQIGPARWRLYDLTRGCRGTESAIGTQALGDRFVLIAAESALALDLPLAALGRTVQILASGVGDADGPVATTVALRGRSVVPPSPVQLVARELGTGDVAVSWVRRSRNGWRWIDGVDAPLGEEREAYRIVLEALDGGVRTFVRDVPNIVVARGDRVLGAVLRVAQIGALGESDDATVGLPAWIS
ncbi:phage tail protein [Sphingomonas sp. PAMC 26605]|uniref:phage tail protein n=1 Tax=Sphingomonas sp. PAMC 26605 TaxID=1112214 RepID=UPI00026CA226|nr:phage tail protein [Sphingomonas sp. PAMC 26605]